MNDGLNISMLLRNFLRKVESGLRESNVESIHADEIKNFLIKPLRNLLESDNKGEDLVEVLISLAKWLDFYSFWGVFSQPDQDRLEGMLHEIIQESLRLIENNAVKSLYGVCGQHEDGACVKGPIGPRFSKVDSLGLKVKGWPKLPMQDAVNFRDMPDILTLSKGERIYRVVGDSNKLDGSWWFRGGLPCSKQEWRSLMAVSQAFNKNKYYIEILILEKPLKVWVGAAASIRLFDKESGLVQDCILKGGGEQIWLNSDQIQNYKLSKQQTHWP